MSFVGRRRGFRLKCDFTGVCADVWLSIVIAMHNMYVQEA